MQNSLPAHSSSSLMKWHSLYQAALFETDWQLRPQRIAEAEKAVLARIRELFHVNLDHIEEDLALDDALYALRALRNCYTHMGGHSLHVLP